MRYSISRGTPGNSVIYMRGVASGGDGNHSGSLPSVGVYLDEQPVTTIGGNLDVHIYDVARIESLSGPQGTLYGASSEAGTIRIITNKPDPSKVEGGMDAEINSVAGGGIGGKKLELVFANDEYKADVGANAYKKLALSDKVVAVVGTASSGVSMAIVDQMARYKVPRTVVFGPLPKTSTGKIQKFELRAIAKAL